MQIEVTSSCPEERIAAEGIRDWPVWSCEVSSFPWSYSERETCLLLEGEVMLTPDGNEPVFFRGWGSDCFSCGSSLRLGRSSAGSKALPVRLKQASFLPM